MKFLTTLILLVISNTLVQSYETPKNISLLLAKLSAKRPPIVNLAQAEVKKSTDVKEVTVPDSGCAKYLHLGADHTMCKYKSKACLGYKLVRSGGLSCNDKIEIVKLHNELRQNVSLGLVPGQPWAQNMVKLVWDDELAMIAQRWADQCYFGHDVNPNVPRFMVGQNIYLYNLSTNDTDIEPRFKQGITRWFSEYTQFPGTVDPFVYQSETGHYTQLAWGATSAIGCGYVMCTNKEGSNKLHVCNYGAHGNTLGGTMYKVGRRNCNKFPNLSNSTSYPGLCELTGPKAASGLQCVAEKTKPVELMPLPQGANEMHLIA